MPLYFLFLNEQLNYMEDSLDKVYKHQSLIYKYILYFVTIGCIVFFFPKGGKFKYEFQKGKPWQYENLYAPFDFSIKKTSEELSKEQEAVRKRQIPYYTYDASVADEVLKAYGETFTTVFTPQSFSNNQVSRLQSIGDDILGELYKNGIFQSSQSINSTEYLYLVKNNEARRILAADVYLIGQVDSVIQAILKSRRAGQYYSLYQELFFDIVKPNVTYDAELSQKELDDE
ncbi:MAG: phosphohydrolase, partial [Muriicola sp.]